MEIMILPLARRSPALLSEAASAGVIRAPCATVAQHPHRPVIASGPSTSEPPPVSV